MCGKKKDDDRLGKRSSNQTDGIRERSRILMTRLAQELKLSLMIYPKYWKRIIKEAKKRGLSKAEYILQILQ